MVTITARATEETRNAAVESTTARNAPGDRQDAAAGSAAPSGIRAAKSLVSTGTAARDRHRLALRRAGEMGIGSRVRLVDRTENPALTIGNLMVIERVAIGGIDPTSLDQMARQAGTICHRSAAETIMAREGTDRQAVVGMNMVVVVEAAGMGRREEPVDLPGTRG